MSAKFGVLCLAISFLTACSGSGGGSAALAPIDVKTMNVREFQIEKEITAQEFSDISSSWWSAECQGGFATGLGNAVFRREDSLASSWVSYFTRTTERVTVAETNQVVTDVNYDVVNVPGLSGPIYVGNKARRVCNYSSQENGTSLECREVGTLTPEAEAFARNLPKNPEESCENKGSSKDQEALYYSGTYVLENGHRVSALMQKTRTPVDSVCNGQNQKRTMIQVEVITNGIKAYPGDSLCRSSLYSRFIIQNENNAKSMDHTERVLEAPTK